ncbi:MAG: formylglycine-generating enzyme family protein [Rubripirellula sp.]|nr:formylglycine-generating enzyme family protein [Rubripirellula sp.]
MKSYRVITFLALSSAVFCVGVADAETPATGSGKQLGVVADKPANGPSVKVANGFMVPYTLTIPGTDVTLEMIPIPGGSFVMGSPADEAGRAEDEGPQVKVIAEPMWVGMREITWAQYKPYMYLYGIFKEFESKGERKVTEENRIDAITAPTELYDPTFTFEYGEEDNQPAVTMTQYSAQQYTKWLSRVTGQQYRLPTEAEWEYAARGGTQTAYSFGSSADQIDDYAWSFDNSGLEAPVVGGKKPNPFGLYDMHGNVAELTVNEYTEDGYARYVDKQPIRAAEMVVWPEWAYPVVARGGSWEMEAEQLRSAARLASDDEVWKEDDPNFPKSPWWFTNDPARGVGFRLFRSYDPLGDEQIKNFWESTAEDVNDDVQARLDGGRGGLGLVDKGLSEAIEKMKN